MSLQAERLTAGLRAEGHEIVNVPTNPLPHESVWRRAPGLRGFLNLALFVRLLPAVRAVDCVHVFSNSYLSFFLFTAPAVLAARLWRRRLVLHYHGGAADAFLERWHRSAGLVLRAADRIVVPSGFLVEVFRRHGIPAVEVPNTIDLDAYPYRPRQPVRPHLLVARHLEPVYNVGCALRAFALVAERQPQALLTVAGDGSERSSLTDLARRLGLGDRVRFVGNVDHSGMLALYAEADVLLNSSRADNQPVSILEAFASGMPVVSTDVGGIPYMVTHGRDGLLAGDDDAEGLARHVMALVDDPALVSRLATEGWRRVQWHAWENVYPLLRALYAGHET
jgi:glycosyltransferase involved in cell wall biosynthesis